MAPKSSKKQKAASKSSEIPEIDPNSSFTPESFERELKNLAAQAKDETWSKQWAEQGSVYLKSATLLSLAAIYSNASQLALSPIYGSIPSSIWHSKLIAAACFAGWSSNLFLNRNLPFKAHLLLPIIAIYIPTVQFFLERFSGPLGARWGPLLTEVLTLFPITALSAACVATYLDMADLTALPKWLGDAAPGLGSFGFYTAVETISGNLIRTYIGRTFFNTRLGLELVLSASYSLLAPSKMLLYAVPALLHTALLNTHVPTPMALGSLNRNLAPENWVILDRRESITGYVSVLENTEQGFRVMRCDHSLLGGEWVKFNGAEALKGNQVAEPIYGVFAMLEAVRLVQVPKPVPDSAAKALVVCVKQTTPPSPIPSMTF